MRRRLGGWGGRRGRRCLARVSVLRCAVMGEVHTSHGWRLRLALPCPALVRRMGLCTSRLETYVPAPLHVVSEIAVIVPLGKIP